jgi:putative ABC transport system permease protein
VLGIEPDYRNRFPEQIRLNVGSWDGVLVAGQTAANLHVSPGDIVTIERIGAPAVDIKVAGIVALPNADSLFQAVGVPKGIAPQAPPDNVLIMPVSEWRTTFGPQRAARPDTVRMQVHVRLAHDEIPSEPSAAFVQAGRTANNLEAGVAGSAAVANNLAARLDGVRADAIYLRLLFLFLGLPGVMLAILVTLGVAASGSERRRREQALLRIRGASISQILQLAWAEAAVIGAVGVILGLVLAGSAALTWLHLESLRLAAPWFILAAGIGFAVAIAAFLVPAWRDAMTSTVSSARADARQQPIPLWQRTYVDLAFLIAGVAAFWSIASTGYQIVLAPEGVAQTSVHYEAFLAPACLWIGAGLFWIRLSRLILGRAQGVIAATITPFARDLGPTVAASLSRQQVRMGRGVALTSLAFAFATATAIFNATYEDQSRVDAELTNGADVTVTGTSSQPAGALLGELTAIPGIAAAKPLMHRFAYVGSDLQDLFGIDPASIGKATTIADAYFANNNAVKALGLLKQNHDGVLVSQETVQDFQLQPGDQLNLRLQSAVDHQYHVVPFHFVGVAREFPTAPKDSFLVANASYIAEQTSSDSHEVVLIRTSRDAESVAAATRELTAAQPGMRVTTLRETQAIISSSLTAIDLRSLTDLELGFAVLMVARRYGSDPRARSGGAPAQLHDPVCAWRAAGPTWRLSLDRGTIRRRRRGCSRCRGRHRHRRSAGDHSGGGVRSATRYAVDAVALLGDRCRVRARLRRHFDALDTGSFAPSRSGSASGRMRCPPGQAAALRRKRGVPCKSPPQFFAYHAIRRVPWISLNIGISLGSVIAISSTSFRRIAMGN